MSGRSTIWFPLALLALLAGLTLWIEHAVQPPAPKIDGSSRHDPDYKVYNFHTVKTSANGNPRYALAAVEMVHYPDDDSTELIRPRFTQYAVNKPYTQVQSQRGQVSSNGENVYFMDNVKIVRGATRQKGELTVLTEYLHVVPEQELAKTDRPVSILQAPRTVIRATGMEYNKKLGTLKLGGRVYVHYEKPDSASAPLRASPAPGAAGATSERKSVVMPMSTDKPSASPKKTTKNKKATKKSVNKASQPVQPGKTRIRRTYEKSATQR